MKNSSALSLTEAMLSIAAASDPMVSQVMLKVVHRQTEAVSKALLRADDPRLWDETWFCSYE